MPEAPPVTNATLSLSLIANRALAGLNRPNQDSYGVGRHSYKKTLKEF